MRYLGVRYRKKPVEIEAIQYEGGRNLNEVYAWIAATAGVDAAYVAADGGFMIRTLEGEHRADPGDWIIRGIRGEHYPCKPDIFDATYDPVVQEGGMSVSMPRHGLMVAKPKPKPRALTERLTEG